jgi:hypothetical protein
MKKNKAVGLSVVAVGFQIYYILGTLLPVRPLRCEDVAAYNGGIRIHLSADAKRTKPWIRLM